MGETQERERILVHFSNRYFYCNPDTIASQGNLMEMLKLLFYNKGYFSQYKGYILLWEIWKIMQKKMKIIELCLIT